MNSTTPTFPHPLCTICDEQIHPEHPIAHSRDFGRICSDCAINHLPQATLAIAEATALSTTQAQKHHE